MKQTFYVRIPAEQVSAGISSEADDVSGCPLTVSDEPWQGELNVTGPEAVTPERITAAARRKLGLPLIIGETERLFLRELCMSDLETLRAVHFTEEELYFMGPEAEKLKDEAYLRSYIGTQYRFFEYGIWGFFRKEATAEHRGRGQESVLPMIGMIGFAPGGSEDCPEFGIYTLRQFRRQGYGAEAYPAAFAYARDELGFDAAALVIRRENLPSRALAEKLKASLPQAEGRFRLSITIL